MTRFNYINQNIDHIKQDIKLGITSSTIIRHYEIYSRFDYYRKLGEAVCMAVTLTCNDLNVDDRMVFRIKKQMENEI